MKKTAFILIFIITIAFSLGVKPAFSEEGLGCGEGFGPLAKFLCEEVSSDPKAGGEKVGNKLNAVISSIVTFLTILASLWFALQFITAGLTWISAGGDKGKLETSQKRIQNALIGITVVVSAWVVLGVIGKMLGLNILNPGKALQKVILQ